MLARTRFLAHSPLTRSPVAALVTRRHLAQIARIQPGVARPLLLEDYPADQRSQLPVFTISKERGFLPRIVSPYPLPWRIFLRQYRLSHAFSS